MRSGEGSGHAPLKSPRASSFVHTLAGGPRWILVIFFSPRWRESEAGCRQEEPGGCTMADTTTQGKKAMKKSGDERFIMEVGEFPVLYNIFLPEYMDINKKAFAWQTIASRLKMDGELCSNPIC